MPSKRDLAQERREQILQAASAVFARRGLHAARMDDIVEAAGLSKGAVYWYFDSKDEIIMALLERFMQAELEDLAKLPEDGRPVSARMLAMADHLVRQLESMADLMPIALEFYAEAPRREKVRQTVVKYFSGYQALLSELIDQGVQRGELRAVDPEDTAVAVMASIEGLILYWILGLFEELGRSFRDQVRGAMTLLLRGLEPKE
jgi:AcrR family transcriptional regulator